MGAPFILCLPDPDNSLKPLVQSLVQIDLIVIKSFLFFVSPTAHKKNQTPCKNPIHDLGNLNFSH